MKDTLFYSEFTLNCKGILRTYYRPVIMGIVNVTPDSFHVDSRVLSENELITKVERLIGEGADWLDVGGYSSRPGADFVSEEEEMKRVVPSIRAIHAHFPEVVISVDTFRSKVADAALKAGASIINDISGTHGSDDMMQVSKKHMAPIIVMHMRGNLQNMMQDCNYENLITELVSYFSEIIDRAKEFGVHDIIIDPGFGFSKDIQTNFDLLNHMSLLQVLDCPILAGLSRKSMIYKTLQINASDALNGTSVLNTVALLNGASILRVHDVKEAKEVADLILKLKGQS